MTSYLRIVACQCLISVVFMWGEARADIAPVVPSKAAMISPAPGTTLSGSTVQFRWSAGTATMYGLFVSSIAPGNHELFGSNTGNTASVLATNLPRNGSTLYVRLYSMVNGVWQLNDYTYSAAADSAPVVPSKAAMISPAPGTTLSGNTVQFSWSAGTATMYGLYVSSIASGNYEMFARNTGNATSVLATNLPRNGSTLYVRLYSMVNGVWQLNDYTYSASSSKSVLQSPAPGSILLEQTVTFRWNNTLGFQTRLDVGSAGIGSSNLFSTTTETALSQLVRSIPDNGSTVYVRLWTSIDGQWFFNDYTFTAPTTFRLPNRDPFCSPTPEQVSNRNSNLSIPIVVPPALPLAGQKYCDPTFGTEVLRISDDDSMLNMVDNNSQVGFNKDSSKIATFTGGGVIRVYDLDPVSLTKIGQGKTIWPIPAPDGGYLEGNATTAFWSRADNSDAKHTILIGARLSYYKVDVDTGKATLLADLRNLVSSSLPTNPNNFGKLSFNRCSASSDTSIIGCAIVLRTPDERYPRVGYVVFQLLSQFSSDPSQNWIIKAKFINGIDSREVDTFQDFTMRGSDGVTYTYSAYNPYEGGYKIAIDRSGRFLVLSAGTGGLNYNSSIVVDTVKQSANQQAVSFLQAGGHGDFGNRVFVGMTTSYGTCSTCMKKWDLSTLTSDPNPDQNNGTPITDPFGWLMLGAQYNSLMAADGVETTLVLACPSSGCGANPPAYIGEIMNLSINGSKVIKRLVRLNNTLSTFGYNYIQTLQSLDGKLVAFTSNFGKPDGQSHVFIVRVRP